MVVFGVDDQGRFIKCFHFVNIPKALFFVEPDGGQVDPQKLEQRTGIGESAFDDQGIHFFIHHAMVAVSLLKGEEEVRPLETLRSDHLFLRDLFQKEFILMDPLLEDRDRVRSVLTDFMDAGLIREDAASAGYRITRMGADGAKKIGGIRPDSVRYAFRRCLPFF